MKVLIACERSGKVREAFKRRGVYAMSCDFQDTLIPGNHYKGSVLDVLNDGWDLMVGHPPCTYLCNSGVCHLHTDPERWGQLEEGADFFLKLWNAPIHSIILENPIPHKYALQLIGRKYDQIVQPWQFGHGETKATCFWLKNLPKLKPTKIVPGRVQRLHRLPPGPERANLRSETYSGIAEAIADQYIRFLENPIYSGEQLTLFR